MPLAYGMILPNTFLCKCERQIAKTLIVWWFCTKGYATFPTSFGTTIGDLWDIYGLSVAISFPFSIFSFPILMRLYNNGVKIFGMEGVLCRRFAVLEDKMVYTTRGKCSIYRASRADVFFLKKVSSREDCAECYQPSARLFLRFRMRYNMNTEFIEQV